MRSTACASICPAIKGGRLAAARASAARDDVCDFRRSGRRPRPTSRRARRSPMQRLSATRSTILERYAYPALDELAPLLTDPALESPKPGDPGFARDDVELIATRGTALRRRGAVSRRPRATRCSISATISTTRRTSSAASMPASRNEQARDGRPRRRFFRAARRASCSARGRPRRPQSRVSLGAGARARRRARRVYALAADTDGIDGHGDHAGGIVTPDMLELGAQRGVIARRARWPQHDSYTFFDVCDLLVRTGPTRTNVNDFRLILCEP